MGQKMNISFWSTHVPQWSLSAGDDLLLPPQRCLVLEHPPGKMAHVSPCPQDLLPPAATSLFPRGAAQDQTNVRGRRPDRTPAESDHCRYMRAPEADIQSFSDPYPHLPLSRSTTSSLPCSRLPPAPLRCTASCHWITPPWSRRRNPRYLRPHNDLPASSTARVACGTCTKEVEILAEHPYDISRVSRTTRNEAGDVMSYSHTSRCDPTSFCCQSCPSRLIDRSDAFQALGQCSRSSRPSSQCQAHRGCFNSCRSCSRRSPHVQPRTETL